jgi:WD40 repeat protein
MSGCSKTLEIGQNASTLKLWDVATGQCLRTFEGQGEMVTSVCLSANGQVAMSVRWDDPLLRLWDVTTGHCLRTLEGHRRNSAVTSVCLSEDGRFALSASNDTTSKLWDAATGKCLRTFEGHTSSVNSVCLSMDGRFALSGSGFTRSGAKWSTETSLKLWEVATGRCLHTFEGHTTDVTSVCLSADGHFALSGSYDKTLKLWEVATGRCLRTFEGHTNDVKSVCLSADGRFALSGSNDKTLKLWFLDWELEENQPADWSEEARPYLSLFLSAHTPYAGQLPEGREPTDEEITRALTRQGRPRWSEDDFKGLLYTLGCAGYGWLRPDGVGRELERMAAAWRDSA